MYTSYSMKQKTFKFGKVKSWIVVQGSLLKKHCFSNVTVYCSKSLFNLTSRDFCKTKQRKRHKLLYKLLG